MEQEEAKAESVRNIENVWRKFLTERGMIPKVGNVESRPVSVAEITKMGRWKHDGRCYYVVEDNKEYGGGSESETLAFRRKRNETGGCQTNYLDRLAKKQKSKK